MASLTPSSSASQSSTVFFEHSFTQNGSGTSSDLVIPEGLNIGVAMGLILVSAGTAKVQISYSSRDSVRAGTANWIDWVSGAVTASKADIAYGISGLRLAVTSGNWVLDVQGT